MRVYVCVQRVDGHLWHASQCRETAGDVGTGVGVLGGVSHVRGANSVFEHVERAGERALSYMHIIDNDYVFMWVIFTAL